MFSLPKGEGEEVKWHINISKSPILAKRIELHITLNAINICLLKLSNIICYQVQLMFPKEIETEIN